MRILYINGAFRHHGSGPAVHGWALVDHLRAGGSAVTVYPPAPGRNAHVAVPPDGWRRRLRHRLNRGPMKLLGGVRRTIRQSLGVWREYRGDPPDVVLARHAPLDWTPWVAARLLRRPLVLEVNAAGFVERKLAGQTTPPLLRWIESYQWRRARVIYTVSRELQGILSSAHAGAGRIHVIPNGADVPPDAEHGPDRDGTRVVFVGGFHPWHGVDQLLEAVAILAREGLKLRLLLIGWGPRAAALNRYAAESGIGDLVEMAGRLPHHEVRARLQASHIAAAPYPRLEPFYFSPLKLFEYMANGLPVVASAQGQIREVIEHGRTGLLYPPDDIEALARELERLARDPALRERIGKSARREIAMRYTWRHAADRVARLCEEVACQPGSG